MAAAASYEGGCHCGAVRYRVSTDFARVICCNCSMCGRSGTLLTFVPVSAFQLLTSEDALSDYLFGRQRIHHLFCRTCGIKSFARGAAADGTPTYAVNVRCLDGIEPESLALTYFDGRAL